MGHTSLWIEGWAVWVGVLSLQLAALVLVAWGCERGLRLRSPQVRYRLWWTVLLLPLFLAPTRLVLHRVHAMLALPAPTSLVTMLPAPASFQTPSALSPSSPQVDLPLPAPPAFVSHSFQASLYFVLVTAWGFGLTFLLLRLWVGYRRMRRLIAHSARIDNPSVQHLLDCLCRTAGVTTPVTLRANHLVMTPLLYGFRYPVILLPGDWLVTLSEYDIQGVLAHEVAHLRRRDFCTNLLQRLLEAVFFFHPGVWLANRRVSFSREELCDVWALRTGLAPQDYARSLTLMAIRTGLGVTLASLGMAEDKSTLSHRVEAIMHSERRSRVGRPVLIALTVVMLVIATAFTIVQLHGQETANGGGGNHPAEAGSSEEQVTGSNGGGGRHEGGGGGGNAVAPEPTQQISLDQLDQKQLRHYQVSKRLANFPDKLDLSTPETTVAAIVRAMLRVDNAQWRIISPPRAERGGGAGTLEPLSPQNAKLYSGMTMEEVWIYQDRWAAVISRYPQLGQKTDYNVRFVIHKGKQWFNLGEDIIRDLVSARNDVARSFQWMEQRPKVEAEALAQAWAHPEEYAAKAEQVFDQLRRVDYAAYLASPNPEELQPLPVDYTVSSDYPSWADWVCKTFSRNPITKVQLGRVVKDELGRPSVPYILTLQDGTMLSGVLWFQLGITPKGTAEWVTGPGLDWHQETTTR